MTNVKRIIGQMTDEKELYEVEKAARARRQVLNERRHAQAVKDAWERIKRLAPGTFLYVCAKGTFFGGPFQRGDKFLLKEVRRRSVVLDHGEKGLWTFPPLQVYRYELGTEPPANPMTQEARESVAAVAERVAASLGGV